MCGRLNVTDDKFVVNLVNELGVDLNITPIKPNRFVRAASPVQIIYESHGQRYMKEALWWLLLEPSGNGFKPSRYTSFNTRYDKLNVPRTAGYVPYRQSRCIIVAKGFGETEFGYQGSKKVAKHYFDFSATDGALSFGGLYKNYQCPHTGEITTGCSIITLPAHEKLAQMHSKASPLMLPQNHACLDAWLNPNEQNVAQFDALLNPAIRQNLTATQIDKPSTYNEIAPPRFIQADSF
ncbi:SOS response-associated peptidase family protein [Thalassotalea sp. PLHSN55]|uniref:SOS response-associated peptidase family protein n=1 Tax=Thalassotalea sp. PLHSN55 TaxID=3435888 RepID=UPI003F87B64B